MPNRYKKIENKNDFYFRLETKYSPDFYVILMRDNSKLLLPKGNAKNSWLYMKRTINRHFYLIDESEHELKEADKDENNEVNK